MPKTQYCRDYGGPKGLSCGYWSHKGDSLDKHILTYHANDSDVFDISRNEYNIEEKG